MVILGRFERVRPGRGSVSLATHAPGYRHADGRVAGYRYIPHSSHTPGGKHEDQAVITKCSLVKVLLG